MMKIMGRRKRGNEETGVTDVISRLGVAAWISKKEGTVTGYCTIIISTKRCFTCLSTAACR